MFNEQFLISKCNFYNTTNYIIETLIRDSILVYGALYSDNHRY